MGGGGGGGGLAEYAAAWLRLILRSVNFLCKPEMIPATYKKSGAAHPPPWLGVLFGGANVHSYMHGYHSSSSTDLQISTEWLCTDSQP